MLYICLSWIIEFLDQTVEAEFESLPAEVRAKTIHISNLIREFGLPNIGLPYIKHVQDKIWEQRNHPWHDLNPEVLCRVCEA